MVIQLCHQLRYNCVINLYPLWANSTDDKFIFFSFFPENRLWQSLFPGKKKIRKIFRNTVCWNLPSILRVNKCLISAPPNMAHKTNGLPGAAYDITKTYLYNFDPLKPHFYIVKLGFTGVYIIFLISAQIEAVLTSIHNLCFEQKHEKYQNFLSENFHFLVVKFSVYLNRHVFVMTVSLIFSVQHQQFVTWWFCGKYYQG